MTSEKLLSKLLFVEDDEVFFNVLRPRLLRAGFFVIWAKDGEEGIKKAKVETPDIVVLDIVMPKVNGFEMIKILKERPLTKGLKFIILSNYGETRLVYDEEFRSALGIEKYLIKSNHTPSEIVREIKEIVC